MCEERNIKWWFNQSELGDAFDCVFEPRPQDRDPMVKVVERLNQLIALNTEFGPFHLEVEAYTNKLYVRRSHGNPRL